MSTMITPKNPKISLIFDQIRHFFMFSVLYFTSFVQFLDALKLTFVCNLEYF